MYFYFYQQRKVLRTLPHLDTIHLIWHWISICQFVTIFYSSVLLIFFSHCHVWGSFESNLFNLLHFYWYFYLYFIIISVLYLYNIIVCFSLLLCCLSPPLSLRLLWRISQGISVWREIMLTNEKCPQGKVPIFPPIVTTILAILTFKTSAHCIESWHMRLVVLIPKPINTHSCRWLNLVKC